MKGKWCDIDNKIFCQVGYCGNCEIYHRHIIGEANYGSRQEEKGAE
jgi:hypothetical protein